jgi:hypothetical protein
MKRLIILSSATLLAGACANTPAPDRVYADVTPFSRSGAGARQPLDWQRLVIARGKAPTRYETVVDAATHRVVLRASSSRAASGLRQALDLDPHTRPRISWEWRVVQLIDGADNTDRHAEDSPVRLMLFFDGDHAELPVRERAMFDLARIASGRSPPYATLMYIWENRQPEDTILPSPFTGQVRMIVAGSGAHRLGGWKRFERDYVADYRRAFGKAPGRLIGVGILTDTDNTGATVEAYYGDIRLQSPAF